MHFSISRLPVILVTVAVLAMSTPLGHAQEFETSYNARFERQKPMIGKPMPEVQVFDSNGAAFRLTKAEDKYTVVVFGCLT